MKLVVTQAFGKYPQGATVSDAAEVAKILASEQAVYVMRIADNAPAAAQSATNSK
jgi:hypothetical protein